MTRVLAMALAAGLAAASAAIGAPARTITHYHWTTVTFDAINQRAAEAFMARNPGVQVNLLLLPEDSIVTILRTVRASAQPIDSFALSNGQSAEFLAAGQMVPLMPSAFGKASIADVLSMWAPGAPEACGGAWEGQYYGVPFELSNYVGWINVADMREAGLDPSRDKPRTWEQFVQVARKLTKVEAGRTVRNGFMCNAKYGIYDFLVLTAMMEQLGLDWGSEKGLVSSMDRPEALVRGFRTFTDLVTSSHVWDPTLADDDRIGFAEHKTSMFLTGGAWFVGLLDTTPAPPVPLSDAEPFPYPRFPDGKDIGGAGYGYCVFVSRQSRDPELAFRFLDAMTSQPNEFIRYGYYQPRRWLSNGSPALDVELARRYVPFYDQVFRPELTRTAVWLASPHGNQVIRLVWQAITRVIYEKASVEGSVAELQGGIRGLFASR